MKWIDYCSSKSCHNYQKDGGPSISLRNFYYAHEKILNISLYDLSTKSSPY